MTSINYEKAATDLDLFHEFKRYMQEYFNTQITKEQFLNFVDLCEKKKYYLKKRDLVFQKYLPDLWHWYGSGYRYLGDDDEI